MLNESPAQDPCLSAPSPEVQAIDVESLYKSHKKFLLAFVRRYVRDSSEAEDVVQSTFLEATRCAAKFSNLSKPSTWLFGIALNLSRNHVRKQMSAGATTVVEEECYGIEDPSADPSRIVETRQLLNLSLQHINSLSEDLKSTFMAVLGDDLSYDIAAKELKIPIGTVRSRLSRVRSQIKALSEKKSNSIPINNNYNQKCSS